MGNVVQNDGVEAYSMNVPLQETFYCAKETKKYEHMYTCMYTCIRWERVYMMLSVSPFQRLKLFDDSPWRKHLK